MSRHQRDKAVRAFMAKEKATVMYATEHPPYDTSSTISQATFPQVWRCRAKSYSCKPYVSSTFEVEPDLWSFI